MENRQAATSASTRDYLSRLFTSRFKLPNLVHRHAEAFAAHLRSRIGVVDAASEGFLDESRQRDLAIKFHWGHNHDFGSGLEIAGRMGNRHIDLIADFVDQYGLPRDLSGKRVLDIGVWTGGTSLLLAAMGAEVTALEEVVKYAEMVNYLAESFGLHARIRCYPRSLYDMLPRFADYFDLVLYAGVIYHVTDPILSLRLIFSALKDDGQVFLETYGCASNDTVCGYEGPAVIHSGQKQDRNRGGWNYFAPSSRCLEAWCRDVGFQEVTIGSYVQTRIQGVARRTAFDDLCRAGLSQPQCR